VCGPQTRVTLSDYRFALPWQRPVISQNLA